MNKNFRLYISNFRQLGFKRHLSRRNLLICCIALFLCGFLLINSVTLWQASSRPVQSFLVLGGSITREIYTANLISKYPYIPVLISQGSPDPCILLIFRREKAHLHNVLLEKCAHSTFDNYYYALPILRQWNVHKVKVITSATHLPRAKWLGQIILGSQGIWVEMEIVPETGIPGNNEHILKTIVDVSRSLIWAILSHIFEPKCDNLTKLTDVNLQDWYNNKVFKCEYHNRE